MACLGVVATRIAALPHGISERVVRWISRWLEGYRDSGRAVMMAVRVLQ
jgi:hypothetical protein